MIRFTYRRRPSLPTPTSSFAGFPGIRSGAGRITTLWWFLLAFLVIPAWTRAEFLQPVDVTVTNGEEIKSTLIDGQGLDDGGLGSPDSIHTTSGSEMWTAIGSIRAEVVFDLGKLVDLNKVYIWNYNVPNDTDRGMKDVQILVSPDSNPATAKFSGIATVTLTEGGEHAQAFDVVGTDVRLVKIKNTSNWGNGYAIGLAEVRFGSGSVVGKVPAVTITGLKDGDTVPLGSELSLAASVTDKDNNVSRVEFFDGSTKLGETNKAPYSISLKSLVQGDHTLRVVVTDATSFKAFASVNVSVREVIPGTVIQIDDNRDIGTTTNQIRYSGTWTLAPGNANDPRFLNNDHYADQAGAYFEVKFVGVKIDVFATVASHHGTGNATIDGGTKYAIDYKAAQRGEQKLVWSSPLLPNREHILRVTVAGNGVVTADRFDVTQSDTPSDERASVKKWDPAPDSFALELEDLGNSRVDTNTVVLRIDGAVVPATITKTNLITTLLYIPAIHFAPGSQHPFQVSAKDVLGNAIGTQASFTVPSPPFPLTGLGEPPATAGNWSVRQVWNAGRADAVVTGVGLAQAATAAGFTGKLKDVASAVINFNFTASPGNAGIFADDAPFPAEVEGLPTADWITVGRARVHVPSTGDWTIGVHSDDGFALRFAGHPFATVAGNGTIDADYPEYISFATGTADSNTRGVLKDLPAGDYVVEFIHFDRVGGAALEIYAAPGNFEADADTSTWALIGATDGLQLVAESIPLAPFSLGSIQATATTVTIDFESAKANGQHTLEESADLKTWTPNTKATFVSTGGNRVRTTAQALGASRFYRVRIAP